MNQLYLTILLPLLGYLMLAFSRGRLSETTAAVVGVGSVGLAALCATWAGSEFLRDPQPFTQLLWHWFSVNGFAVDFALRLDAAGAFFFAGTAGYMTSSFFSGKVISKLGVGGTLAASCALTASALPKV